MKEYKIREQREHDFEIYDILDEQGNVLFSSMSYWGVIDQLLNSIGVNLEWVEDKNENH